MTWVLPSILKSRAVPISLLALGRSDRLRPKPLRGLSTLAGADVLPGPAPPVPLPPPWGLVAFEWPVSLNLTVGQHPRGQRTEYPEEGENTAW